MNLEEKKLLVIDDDKAIRTLYGVILGKLCNIHDVQYSKDGEEGLEAALSDSYDLILSDIDMPVRDGISLHRSLKERAAAKARTVAFISGNICTTNLSYLIEEDVPFIEKPFQTKEFVTFIKAMMKKIDEENAAGAYFKGLRMSERKDKAEDCIIIPPHAGETVIPPISAKTFDFSDGGLGLCYKGEKLPSGKRVNVIIEAMNIFNRNARVVWTSVSGDLSFKSGLQWL